MSDKITSHNIQYEYEKGMDVVTDPSDAYDNGWKEGREDMIKHIKESLTKSIDRYDDGGDLMLDIYNILITLEA